MTARCPNDSDHKEFITVVHQAQDAIVDEHGNFLRNPENLDAQQTHGPNIDNNWQCVKCGTTAVVVAGDHAAVDGRCPSPPAEAIRHGSSRCGVCDGYISPAFSDPMFGL
jgi:hypothetical protein